VRANATCRVRGEGARSARDELPTSTGRHIEQRGHDEHVAGWSRERGKANGVRRSARRSRFVLAPFGLRSRTDHPRGAREPAEVIRNDLAAAGDARRSLDADERAATHPAEFCAEVYSPAANVV